MILTGLGKKVFTQDLINRIKSRLDYFENDIGGLDLKSEDSEVIKAKISEEILTLIDSFEMKERKPLSCKVTITLPSGVGLTFSETITHVTSETNAVDIMLTVIHKKIMDYIGGKDLFRENFSKAWRDQYLNHRFEEYYKNYELITRSDYQYGRKKVYIQLTWRKETW